MPQPVLLLSRFQTSAQLAGRPLSEHLMATLARAAAESTSGEEGYVTLDATYATVSPKTLAFLLETLAREGGTLFTAGGDLVAVANPNRPASEDTLQPVGEALRVPAEESLTITDHHDLAAAERAIMLRRLMEIGRSGARIVDPHRVWIGHGVVVEPRAVIWPDVVLRGDTRVAGGAEIQSGCWLQDTTVSDGALVRPNTVCDQARIGDGCTVGPMAHLRPGTVLMPESKIGNFVETKKTTLGAGAKASHLTYLGDTEVGAGANIGAGTITCNYDGYGKHRTHIGEGAFIGSNTALVAPVHVGSGAIVGAGSTIARDIPADALAVERGDTRVLEGKAPVLNRRNQAKAKQRRNSDG